MSASQVVTAVATVGPVRAEGRQAVDVATVGKSTAEVLAHEALLRGIEARLPMHDVQRLYAVFVTAACGQNKTHAAEVLRVTRRSLQRWSAQDRWAQIAQKAGGA